MQLKVGTLVEGKVDGITNFGAFVDLSNGQKGMIHISEVSTDFVRDIKDYLKVGQEVKAVVIKISEKNEIALSIKKLMQEKQSTQRTDRNKSRTFGRENNRSSRPGNADWQGTKKNSAVSFEEMLSSFKHRSEEKISDLKRATESKRGGFSRRGAQR